MHQAFNRFADEEFRHFVAGLFGIGAAVLVSSAYLIIKLDRKVPKVMLAFWVFIFVFSFTLATFLLSFGIKIRTMSRACCTANLHAQLGGSNINIRFWRSSWPICINVGVMFKMETKVLAVAFMPQPVLCHGTPSFSYIASEFQLKDFSR